MEPLEVKETMRTSPPHNRILSGFFLMDAMVALLIALLTAGGVYQAFSSLTQIAAKQDAQFQKAFEELEHDPFTSVE